MSPSIATHIKRAIHAGTSGVSRVVFRRDAYKSKPIIRAYITHYVTRECNKPGGLNSQGAVFAELRGTCHHGGTDPTEPFHGTFKFRDANGHPLPTKHPKTGLKTYSHHIRIAHRAKALRIAADRWASSSQ